MNKYMEQFQALNLSLAAVEQELIDKRIALTNSEQEFAAQLQSAKEEIRQLEQEGGKREKVLTEQALLANQKLETLLCTLAEREKEVASQLLHIQQHAAREQLELVRSQHEYQRTLQGQHSEREGTLTLQIQAVQQELRGMEQERTQREKEHSEQASQTRLEMENLLSTLVQREREVASQLLAIQQQAADEKLELLHRQNEYERTLQRQHTEREEALTRQLLAVQQELRGLEQDWVQREKGYSEQISKTRQELESFQHALAQREREVADQLLAIQQQAAVEKLELASKHNEQERILRNLYKEREETITRQLQAVQQELLCLEQDRTQREKEHSEQISQTRQELENSLSTLARREQEAAAQLLVIHQQAAKEKLELASSHNEQERILRLRHCEREEELNRQIQAVRQELRQLELDRLQHEKELVEEIATLQAEKEVLYRDKQGQQHHNDQLKSKLEQNKRLIDACASVEVQLTAEIKSERETSHRLRQSLAKFQQCLETTHKSFSWRITAPLRKLASISRYNKTPSPSLPMEGGKGLTQVITPPNLDVTVQPPTPFSGDAVILTAIPAGGMSALPGWSERLHLDSQSINIQHPPLQSIMLPSANANNKISPTLATTLDELLSYHDEQFVHSAYLTLLGREPDPEGLGYYLGRVRRGYSKMHLVAQLRTSKEGRLHAKERKSLGASLPRLDKAIRHHQRVRLPLIGWLFKLFSSQEESDHPTERKLRGIDNQLFLLREENDRRFNQMQQAILDLSCQLSQQTQSNLNLLDKLLQQTGEIKAEVCLSTGNAVANRIQVPEKNFFKILHKNIPNTKTPLEEMGQFITRQ